MLFQVPLPNDSTNPWVWLAGAMVVVGGALFLENKKSVDRLIDEKEGRAVRCETREGLVLEDNRSQAKTIAEQSTTLVRVASVAEDTFALAKQTAEKIDENRKVIEALRRDARAKP